MNKNHSYAQQKTNKQTNKKHPNVQRHTWNVTDHMQKVVKGKLRRVV